jgi:cation diffusion facilitator CzcD-associated flavoprotein CzcO
MSFEPRIVIIGAGMAGILSVIKLREAGYRNFVVYEKSDRIGGTWRENTYPGIACDVPAHLYTYSFEPNPDWSNTFATGAEIQRIEAGGVRLKSGELRELDVLVMATGFRTDSFIRPAVVKGRNGIKLDEVWADHPVAYLSISIPQFPNFFMLNGPNGPVGNFSLILIAENQLNYILQLMEKIRGGQCREITPRVDASSSFEATRIDAAKKSIWATGCKSWYLDQHGVPASWPWSRERFFERMKTPEFEAYELAG